jgi:ubiquinone/menaquinone biosynthesis C-methylase UbiE
MDNPTMRKQLIAFAALLFVAASLIAAPNPSSTATNRAASLKQLFQALDLKPGAIVADVGCGDGGDSLVFASLVGDQGAVLAEEIDSGKVKRVLENAQKRSIRNVTPVLGSNADPCLPNNAADLIYMCRVFHHFSRPEAMLREFLQDLKPGGKLVIVDQQKGPLPEYAPMAQREGKHIWTGETTVVRLARGAGFEFAGVYDKLWHEKGPFVLAFRKPVRPFERVELGSGGKLDTEKVASAVGKLLPPDGAVAIWALDHGRAVVPDLKTVLGDERAVYDVVLEEWALDGEELPLPAPLEGAQVLRPRKNKLDLPGDARLGLVLFLDAYHRLWDPLPLLRQMKSQLTKDAKVLILDRTGPEDEPRRIAGHQRRIAQELVRREMRDAGFELTQKLRAPGKDRFFLVFEPSAKS